MRDPHLPEDNVHLDREAESSFGLDEAAAAMTDEGSTTYLQMRQLQHFSTQSIRPSSFHERDHHYLRAHRPPPDLRWMHGSQSTRQGEIPAPNAIVPAHRVYVLRCRTCDTFLSDRGMRAVLLLKPHIVLFSTDALPINTGTIWPSEMEGSTIERTCDCLTSSLACQGCGSTVGYSIVMPCARCTASVQRHQRSANHHRYVFHAGEVTYNERRCYDDEMGVIHARPIETRSGRKDDDSPSSSPEQQPQRPWPQERKDSITQLTAQSPPPPRHPLPCQPHGVRPGEVVYWHHLVPGGERPSPVDPKSRPHGIVQRSGR